MPERTPEAPTRRPEPLSGSHGAPLQTWLGLGLSAVVVLGTLAMVELDRRVSARFLRLPVDRVAEEPESAARPAGGPPTLVVEVVLDGLRADHRDAADHLAALEDVAVRFETALAQATSSAVSTKSVLTGKYPASLILEETGADLEVLVAMDATAEFLGETFANIEATLPLYLRAAGYRADAFTDGAVLGPNGTGRHGFDTLVAEEGGLREAAEGALALLERASDRTFLYLQTGELLASGPAATAEEYARRLARADEGLGVLVEGLRHLDRWDESLVVVHGTFGQGLGERPEAPVGDLFLEQLRVPLVLKLPASWRVRAGTVEGAVELVDVLPSLLIACGVEPPRDLDGASFLPMLLRGVQGKEHLVAQTSWTPDGANAARRSVIRPGEWQVIHDARSDRVEYFCLSRDPDGLVHAVPSEEEAPPFLRALLREASLVHEDEHR